MSRLYKVLYRLGVTPWERMPTLPVAQQATAMLDREEGEREPPYGQALDLGCGSGIWSIELARRGWQVTGIDIVPRAVRRARERARQAGVEVQFVEGDVAALRAAGVGSGFRLVLDFGAVHGLSRAAARVRWRGGERSHLPRRDPGDVRDFAGSPGTTAAWHESRRGRGGLPGLEVIDEAAFDVSGGCPLKNAAPRWYRLRRE